MGEYNAKDIQTNLGTFRHNKTYPGIIQAYLEPCINLTYIKLLYILNPGTFRTALYSKRWHIQNLRLIQNPVSHLQ